MSTELELHIEADPVDIPAPLEEEVRLKVFGEPLSEVCARENQTIPTVAEDAINYLEEKALHLEGLFRIPGNSIVVDQLKAYYDGESDSGAIQQCDDIHAVAGLLKLYLRTLPDPLLTYRFYDTFIAVQKNSDFDYRMTNLRKLVNALPKSHKNLLCRLFRFLLRVATFSTENKMSIQNLAIVFGPNLLRPQDDNVLRIIDDARYVNGITLALLEEFNYLVACTSSTPAAVLAEKEKDEAAVDDKIQMRELQRSASVRPVSLSRSMSRSMSRRRGFGKFNVEELAEQVAEADREKAEQEKVKVSEKDMKIKRLSLSREVNASTPNLSPLLSALIMTEQPFDLSCPLEFITKQMQIALASDAPWPSQSIRDMSLVQRIEEKALVKGHLRAFDNAYKEAHGFLPGKDAKEPLRTVYKRYRDLTRSIEIEKREGPPRAQTPRGQSTRSSLPEVERPTRKKKKPRGESKLPPKPSLDSSAEYKALKKQKRELQCLLHRFQEDFVAQHGRKVQHAEDRAPIQKEYDTYRDLKNRLAQMEAEAGGSLSSS